MRGQVQGCPSAKKDRREEGRDLPHKHHYMACMAGSLFLPRKRNQEVVPSDQADRLVLMVLI
jgi:hypothetical protein